MKRLFGLLLFSLLFFSVGCLSDNPPAQPAKNISYNSSLFVPQSGTNVPFHGSVIPETPSPAVPNSSLPAIEYYFSSHCSASSEVAPLMVQVKSDFAGNITILAYDVSTSDGFSKYNEFAAANGIPQNVRYVPVIKIGDKILTGTWGINKSGVYGEIYNYLNGNISSASGLP